MVAFPTYGLPPQEQLAHFAWVKSLEASVFGLTSKSISTKISGWAPKAGVPGIHAHSLRSHFTTILFERDGNPRAIQSMLGHKSLETTMRYGAVSVKNLKDTIKLL